MDEFGYISHRPSVTGTRTTTLMSDQVLYYLISTTDENPPAVKNLAVAAEVGYTSSTPPWNRYKIKIELLQALNYLYVTQVDKAEDSN